ncbi:MAG: hypothetical protein AB9856_02340 [Cellulosilyticaceae bacterium]
MTVHYLQGFEVEPNKNYILTRLGYKRYKTEVGTKTIIQIQQWINEALQLNRPKAAYSTVKIIKKNDDTIMIPYPDKVENEYIVLKSKKLCAFLEEYQEVLLVGATVGPQIVTRIKEEFKENPTKAVVYDATASQSADACLDVVVTLLRKIYGLKGSTLSPKRYSPGYGDLSLETQKAIADFLGLYKIGVTVNDSFMLEPEKSVIAIVGIK